MVTSTEKKVVSIHQPNFLPWLGYFDKIRKSDVFIFLDDVQVPKKGGSWSNRVKILIGGNSTWLTVPIARSSGFQKLNQIKIVDSEWRKKCLESIAMAYSRASHYEETMELISSIFSTGSENLAEWNSSVVRKILRHLDLAEPTIQIASEIDVSSTATQRICDLVGAVGGTDYLCGGGSGGYLDVELFEKSRIELHYQAFKCAPYPQLNTSEFQEGLSIVDALMTLGAFETKQLLNSD
jgi:hypothetical protein